MRANPDSPSPETLAALIKQGLNRQQIANRLGLRYVKVRHLLKAYGLEPLRQKWGARREYPQRLASRDAVIMRDLAAGITATALAEQYGISMQRIYQIAERNGLTRAEVKWISDK